MKKISLIFAVLLIMAFFVVMVSPIFAMASGESEASTAEHDVENADISSDAETSESRGGFGTGAIVAISLCTIAVVAAKKKAK